MADIGAGELSSKIIVSEGGDKFSFNRDMNYNSLSREDLKAFMENVYVYEGIRYIFDRVDFEIDYEGDYRYDGRDEFYDPQATSKIVADFIFVRAIG